MKKRIPLIFTLSVIAIGFASVGASCPPSTTATGVTVTTDIAGEVICVLQHDTLPPAQIVVACVGLALTDVENILLCRSCDDQMARRRWHRREPQEVKKSLLTLALALLGLLALGVCGHTDTYAVRVTNSVKSWNLIRQWCAKDDSTLCTPANMRAMANASLCRRRQPVL